MTAMSALVVNAPIDTPRNKNPVLMEKGRYGLWDFLKLLKTKK
jgi:hypothetical protein